MQSTSAARLKPEAHRRLILQIGLLVLIAVLAIFIGGLLIATRGASGRSVNRASIDIDAPREIVFEFLTDPDLTPRWIGGVESSTPLTDGGLVVGARSKEVVVAGEQRLELITEITAIDAPSHLGLSITTDQLSVEVTYDLTESDRVTHLEYEGIAHYEPLMVRLAEPFIRVSVQNKLEEDLARLQQLAEGSAL